MKLIFVLALLCTVVVAQVPQPFEFKWSDIQDIWQSPRLQPALRNITSRYKGKTSGNGNELGKIVGGSFARTGQFPFHVLTVIDEMWWCGGSLLNANWVLTAAHCIYESFHVNIYSIVDVNQGYYWTSTSAQLIVHEHYDDYEIVNDIGLIRTTSPAPNNAYTSYISLPYNYVGNSLSGYTATIQGFGVYSDAVREVSDVKRYVDQTIMASAECFWLPFDTELCTDTTGGRGSCNGDSGGGLFLGDANNHNDDRAVVGIVSFGLAAGCEYGYPVVYTRVTQFLPWLQAHMN